MTKYEYFRFFLKIIKTKNMRIEKGHPGVQRVYPRSKVSVPGSKRPLRAIRESCFMVNGDLREF